MLHKFKAGTQYNDYVGTVAADRSDNLDITKLLEENDLIEDGEHVVGFEIVFTENQSRPVPQPGIVAFLTKGRGVDAVKREKEESGCFELRTVEIPDLPIAEFFAYFKRFNIVFASKGLDLNGAEYKLAQVKRS